MSVDIMKGSDWLKELMGMLDKSEDYLVELRRFNDNLEALRMLPLGKMMEALFDFREMAIDVLGWKDKGLKGGDVR